MVAVAVVRVNAGVRVECAGRWRWPTKSLRWSRLAPRLSGDDDGGDDWADVLIVDAGQMLRALVPMKRPMCCSDCYWRGLVVVFHLAGGCRVMRMRKM